MSCDASNLLIDTIPGTTKCGLNKEYEMELLHNITNYGLWNHLAIYADYVPIHDIIKHEKKKWQEKYGNESCFPNYIVTNHFGTYCIFSRDFFPIYFHVASSFGSNNVLFVLLESKSPWYFSTRQSVTGIPDIRLYQIEQTKGQILLGQYITSGQRSYDGFKYWLEKYTQYDNEQSYPLLISKPVLYKDINKNKKYYQENYQTLQSSSFYDFDALNNISNHLEMSSSLSFNVNNLIQASAIIEDKLIAYISTGLSLLLIMVTLIKWMYKGYQRFIK